MKVPKKIEDSEDFRTGTKKAKLIDMPIWLVEITMPKDLIADIRSGSIELEGEEVDLEALNQGYEEDLDKAETEDTTAEELQDTEAEQAELAGEEELDLGL